MMLMRLLMMVVCINQLEVDTRCTLTAVVGGYEEDDSPGDSEAAERD